MEKHQNFDAELLMLCGALHDIGELARQENIRLHIKTVQEKLEKITLANLPESTILEINASLEAQSSRLSLS